MSTSLSTIGLAFTYASALAVLTLLIGGDLPPVLAMFIAAAALSLLLPPVARNLARLIHGPDDDPHDLSVALTRILAGATSPSTILIQMEQLIAARLHFPAVEIVQDAAFPTGHGDSDTYLTRIPLHLGTAKHCALVIHHRQGQRRLTR